MLWIVFQVAMIAVQMFMMILEIIFIFFLIAEIFTMLACPYSIFINLPLCIYFWFLDILFTIIWFFIWILSFILIFLPVWLVFSVICIFYKPLCIDISVDDVCINRKDFFKIVDFIYKMIFDERFLNRDDGDVNKCYCSDSLIDLFDPLINYHYPTLDNINGKEGSNIYILVVAFIILCVLYSTNSKSAKI